MKNKLSFKVFVSLMTLYISSALFFTKIGKYMLIDHEAKWWNVSTLTQNKIWDSKIIALFIFPSLITLILVALVIGTLLIHNQLFGKVEPPNKKGEAIPFK
ncbi:hypothetical protein J0801_28885 [Bacillus cereus]|uniref:hypothetical protein n=1 Tax=Bacillus cereus TaxID=1396 RepID=UPI002FDC5B1D